MLLDPHYGTIIWTIVTFVLVLFVLAKFAWPQLLGALDERENRIREALEGAEQARDSAEAALAEHQSKLAEAESEARQIVAQSREAAEKVHQDVVAKAREGAFQKGKYEQVIVSDHDRSLSLAFTLYVAYFS